MAEINALQAAKKVLWRAIAASGAKAVVFAREKLHQVRRETMDKCSENVIASTRLLGLNVTNASGEQLGKINEIVLEKASGYPGYLVLELKAGGVKRFFAIPWQQLQIESVKSCADILVALSRAELETHEIIAGNWPGRSLSLRAVNRPIEHELGSECAAPPGNIDAALQAVVAQPQQQTQSEILQKTDNQGYNLNSSEQHVYPGVQLHQPNIGSNATDKTS